MTDMSQDMQCQPAWLIDLMGQRDMTPSYFFLLAPECSPDQLTLLSALLLL